MARMKTGRMTAKMGGPGDGIVVTSKKETVSPRQLTKREAQFNTDVAAGEKYKSDLGSYNKNIKTYNENKTDSRSYANFGGGPVDVSAEGLKQYNSTQGDGLKATRIQRPKAGGSEGDYLKRLSKEGGYVGHVDYEKPIAPGKPRTPNVNDMPMDKLPMLKVTGVKTKQSMAKGKEAAEKADFSNPPKKAGGNAVSMNPLAGGAKTKGAGKRYVKQVVASVGSPNNRGYNKEEKRFKAYAGTTATGESLIAKSAQEIGQYKNEMKGMRKEYRKEAPSDTRAMGLAATTSEIRQARKAEKFVKNDKKFFTDKNYGGNIAKDYRESSQNAANRNTMDAKIKAAGNKQKSKAASFGNMPTS